jgi:flagellar protein FliS
MTSQYARQAYLNAAVQHEPDSERLILLLYEGALKHIRLAKEGIEEGNARKRGENLSRSVAIISALNASLDTRIQDEAIAFLRGLYEAMLVELAKVAVTHDVQTLDRAFRYLERLKEIWEQEVINKKAREKVSASQPDPAKAHSGYDAPSSGLGRAVSV